MSLVNKMLQDLEARRDVASVAAPVYQDLRPVRSEPRRSARRLFSVLALVLAAGAALYFAAGRYGVSLGYRAAAPTPSTPTAISVAQAPPTPSAPAPVREASVPEQREAPPTPSAPEPQRATPAQSAAAKAAIDKPALAVAPPPPAPARPGSQKKSDVRIVKPKAPTPAPMHKGEREPINAPLQTAPTAVAANAEEGVAVMDKRVRPLTAEEDAEAEYRRAVRLLDQGRSDDAMQRLRDALREQPAHVKARELAAGIALQSGHWREAQSLLEEGLRQVPSHYVFARLLARVYLDHGAEPKALALMESAAPHGTEDPEFSSLLGLLYQRAGRHADAVKVYEHALALRPNDARTWLGFAISLEATEQWGAAKNAYLRAKQSEGLTPTLLDYAEHRLAALKDR